MGGPVGYRTDDKNRRSALSAVAQAEPPVLLSTPVRLGGAGAIRAAPRVWTCIGTKTRD
jgi:hypothetical protein